jgi:transposase
MLTQEESVELNALVRRGWKISQIARHLGRDRKTVRAYIRGERVPGQRRSLADADSFEPYVGYIGIRLRDDPHVWASTLYDEVKALGFPQSYVTFARQVRLRKLRPHCEACAGVRGRDTIEIEHPAGEEIQLDWQDFEQTPWGAASYLLTGTLSYSGKSRGVFAESMDQGHLLEAIDGVLRKLGGTARRWRVDRLAGAVDTRSGRLLASFAPVAKYYGVSVDVCPPRRANRKGAVEKHQYFSAQRWWRTAEILSQEEAQVKYDHFEATTGDGRERRGSTVAELAEDEHLMTLPLAPYPATVEEERTVGDSALVAFRGNQYGIGPGLAGTAVRVRHRVGSDAITIVSSAGATLAEYRLSPPGAGVIQRLPEHRQALEKAILAAFTTKPPCRRKENRPPSPEAKAAAARLRSLSSKEVVVDLARYDELVGVR